MKITNTIISVEIIIQMLQDVFIKKVWKGSDLLKSADILMLTFFIYFVKRGDNSMFPLCRKKLLMN